MSDNSLHDAKTDVWCFLILICFVLVSVSSFLYLKNKISEIRYAQSTENLGTFLITKVNEQEKGCSKINMQIGDVSVGKIYRDKFIKGDMIFIPNYGKFVVKSFGNHNSIDIYTPNLQDAKKHGAKRARVYLLGDKK